MQLSYMMAKGNSTSDSQNFAIFISIDISQKIHTPICMPQQFWMLSATFFCYCFNSKWQNFGRQLMRLYVLNQCWISLQYYSWRSLQRPPCIIKHKSNTYLQKKQVQVCEQVCKFNPLCMSRFTRSKFPFKSKASASSAVCSLAFVSILLVNSQVKCTVKIFVQTGFAFLKICKNYFQILYKTIIEVDIFCIQIHQIGVCRTYLSDPLYSGTIFLKFYSRPGQSLIRGVRPIFEVNLHFALKPLFEAKL